MRNKKLRLAGLLGAAWLLLAAGPEGAGAPTAGVAGTRARVAESFVSAGSHKGFGRIILTPAPGTRPEVSQQGDKIIVTLPDGSGIAGSATAPRNVTALHRGPGRLEIAIAAQATMRAQWQERRLTIDILDPAPDPAAAGPPLPTAAAPAVAAPATAAVEPASRQEILPLPPIPPITARETPVPAADTNRPATAPASPPAPQISAPPTSPPEKPQAGPPSLAARANAAEEGDGILLPFEAEVGAAAFRRGDLGLIVFDQRRPLDLAALRAHPDFAGASVQLLAGGTLLRVPLAADAALALARQPQGWLLTLAHAAAVEAEPIRTRRAEGRLLFAAAAPGAVVTLADPETGATLLIGTQRRAGQALAVTRHWATFIAPRSWQGLVVEPLSDTLSLRLAPDGFALSGGPAGLPLGDDTQAGERMAQASTDTRRFGFTSQPAASLRGMQRTQLLDAADAPPLARGPKRRALGLTLLSLDLAPEAQTVLQIAAADDPREAESPEAIGLSAIAALLAGRMEETAGLDDPRLADWEEARFWRAIRLAMRNEGAPAAGADFAATIKLVQSYPEPLRERLLPLVAETLILTDHTDLARGMLAQAGDIRRGNPAGSAGGGTHHPGGARAGTAGRARGGGGAAGQSGQRIGAARPRGDSGGGA